jgi:hypothetical protein
MRGFFWMVGGLALAGCGGSHAEVDGSAGGVDFSTTEQVYFGGPFIVISKLDVTCDKLDFVRRNYEIGQAPTDDDTQLLQFGFTNDSGTVTAGTVAVDIDAAASASVVNVSGGTFVETIASGGILTVDEVVDEDHVSGSFDGLVFSDGTLTGTFDGEWCRNLKAQ